MAKLRDELSSLQDDVSKSSDQVFNQSSAQFSELFSRMETYGNKCFPSSCLPPLQSESKCEVYL